MGALTGMQAQSWHTQIPVRAREWEKDEAGVVVLVPKFRSKLLHRLIGSRLRRPHYGVHLDAYGSAVWELCDGYATVGSIAARLLEKFGSDIEPIDERLRMFLERLHRSRLIHWKEER